jgi:hypothetical protein
MGDKNVLEHTESDIVQWLLDEKGPGYFWRIASILYPPDQYGHMKLTPHQKVNPGWLSLPDKQDIDLLVIPDDRPENSVALQIKQTKIRRDQKGREYLEKKAEKKIEKGIKQSLANVNNSFWLVYFLLVVEYDGSSNSHGFGAPAPSMFGKIDKLLRDSAAKLDEKNEIGLLFLRVSQISTKSIDRSGGVTTQQLQSAVRRNQPSSLTDLLRKLPKMEYHYCNYFSCPYMLLPRNRQEA